ncbi:MAG: crossover junction endodeoxyribonuclease RuvC, partial [Proteobacteria bacterium]|nr:crossover junction endodeoxyribonuclease RuvC [Pseudomonadota bacterium]
KSQVAAMVRLILGVQENWPVDASDALALAICHANRCSTLP